MGSNVTEELVELEGPERWPSNPEIALLHAVHLSEQRIKAAQDLGPDAEQAHILADAAAFLEFLTGDCDD